MDIEPSDAFSVISEKVEEYKQGEITLLNLQHELIKFLLEYPDLEEKCEAYIYSNDEALREPLLTAYRAFCDAPIEDYRRMAEAKGTPNLLEISIMILADNQFGRSEVADEDESFASMDSLIDPGNLGSSRSIEEREEVASYEEELSPSEASSLGELSDQEDSDDEMLFSLDIDDTATASIDEEWADEAGSSGTIADDEDPAPAPAASEPPGADATQEVYSPISEDDGMHAFDESDSDVVAEEVTSLRSRLDHRNLLEPEVKTGFLAYNPPVNMRVQQSELIEARISKQITGELLGKFEGRGEVRHESTPIASAMCLSLYGDRGAFDIERESDDVQFLAVSDRDYVEWRWRVLPLKRGIHKLRLEINGKTIKEGIEGSMPFDPVIKEVTVQVSALHVMGNYARIGIPLVISALLGGLVNELLK